MLILRLALLAATAEAAVLLSPGVATNALSTRSVAQKQAGVVPGCTTNSFEIPSWYVHNFTFSKADGTAAFHLLNRATNYTAQLACGNSTASSSSNGTSSGLYTRCSAADESQDDPSLLALVRVAAKNGTSTARILLSQSWRCNDRNLTQPLKFAASGNSSVALRCTGSPARCAAVDSPLLIRGTLQSPVAVTPVYAEGPIGHAKAGCAAAAKAPSWTLASVYYLNQTGDNGATSIASQTLMLQVVNHAIGYQAGCTGFLADDLSTTPTAFACSGQGYDFIGKDRYSIQTQALFEPATFRFTVNQTWYCDDEDPAKPVSITATGSVVLPLNCTSVPIDAAAGSTSPPGNKTTCVSTSDIVVPGQQPGTVTSLPPYSIEDPLPTPDGCTVSSLVAPAWIFSSFELDRPAGTNDSSISSNSSSSAGGGNATVGFDLQFRTATNDFTFPVSVYQGPPVSEQQTSQPWYTCTFGPDEVPLAPYTCSYTYDGATKKLTLAADWICSDLDPEHPILFSGTTTTTVTKPLSCSTSGGLTRCLTDESATWNAPIANVTWRRADKDVLAPS
ncbi:hypothetical protein SPI_01224 [Niveomyces insectorum RCEF 264]|uniref:AA1-like domain-containing protein n=1 Tax=Niveomyces insectorum RCEF 264 TaxID=1081102 RepID=A0A167YSV6_9HYPO|nr:hypothetical protein SPI_01224 [Niveomyces insectorum RCEF 264]